MKAVGYQKSLPVDDANSLVDFETVPESPDYDRAYWGQRCYAMAALPNCDPDEAERLIAPLRNLGPKVADFSGRMAYGDLQKLFDAMHPAGQFRCYWKSHFLKTLTDEMIDEALDNAIANPSDHSISSLWNFGGAVSAVPAEATAFGARDFGWMYSLDSAWQRPEDDAMVRAWTRAAWERFRRHAHERRLYLNFAGQDEDSPDLTRDAFGSTFDKLAAIKAVYDPTNRFRFNQNIPPIAAKPDGR